VLKLAKVIFSLNPLSYHLNPWESKLGAKGRGERALECLGAFGQRDMSSESKGVTVGREGRAIYTQREIQPFRSEPELLALY
jgi:hypothetical protein